VTQIRITVTPEMLRRLRRQTVPVLLEQCESITTESEARQSFDKAVRLWHNGSPPYTPVDGVCFNVFLQLQAELHSR